MKVVLEIDGEPREVDVDLGLGVVRVGAATYPVRVLARTATSVEIEIAGERLRITDWPVDTPSPSDPVALEGERFRVRVRVEETGATSRSTPSSPTVGPAPSAPARTSGPEDIVPPMPGRVVELRVQEGQRVAAGDVLLVLEAMKMRNEVASPRAGVVRELRVSVGSNVKGREPMLRVVPEA